MRVIILTSSKNASGGSRQALYLAEGLEKKGHDVVFFAPQSSKLRQLNPNLNWQDLPDKGFFKIKKALENALLTSDSSPVILHSFHNKGVKLAAFLGTLWRIKGLPIACAAHRGVIYKPNNPLPYLLPGIRQFIVNSQACANTLPLLWRKNRVTVVYNSIPKERVTPLTDASTMRASLNIHHDATVIGTVANNTPVKGISYLLQAFAQIKKPNTVLLMVGLAEEKWQAQLNELGITENVRIIPRTNNVADYMNIFDLFVLPSLMESQPNVLLEAMCMGLPAVATAVGGVPEILQHKELLCPPKNSSALTAKIELILDIPDNPDNPELLRKAAQVNLEQSKMFSEDYRINKIEEIYRKMLAELK